MNSLRGIRLLCSLFLVLAMIAAGCGDDDDDSGAEGTDDGPAATASGGDGDAESDFAPSRNEVEASDDASSDDGSGDDGGDGGESADDGGADDAMAEDDGGSAVAAEEPQAAPSNGGLFDDAEREADVDRPDDDDGTFENYGVRDFIETDDDPLSTFALDVDTGAFSVGRRYLQEGSLPPVDSVRVEEYVNSFDYGYDDPRGDALGLEIDGGPSPFDDDNYIVRIGVQSERLDDRDRPSASLTFVIDTSGSMESDGKLELVKEALEELVEELDENDTVAIVEFDDEPSVVLEPTRVRDADDIIDAIDDLETGGSTNVEGGLELGYDLADDGFRDDGVNRVILLSDGVANVGLVDPDGLAESIRRDADRGIQLLTIGVGLGDFNDVLLEQLADQGDGFYAYVDTKDEAERLFEDDLTATLVTLAIDAKIQVEFDEDIVEEYRLIGFENRGVRDSDFRNDDVDAGEIGAGHQVTAIYEIELQRGVDLDDRDELAEVDLRWEEPGTGRIVEISTDIDLRDIEADWDDTSDSFKLATTVATFAEVLRESPFADDIDLDDLAVEVDRLADRYGTDAVEEFSDLVNAAERLS